MHRHHSLSHTRMVAPDALISIFGAPSCTVATATDREGGAWTGSVPAPASRPPGAGPEQVGVVHSTRTTAGPRSGPESQPLIYFYYFLLLLFFLYLRAEASGIFAQSPRFSRYLALSAPLVR